MNVTFEGYVFATLYGKCLDAGWNVKAVSLLMDSKDNPKLIAGGTGRPPTSTRTSIVNAIQQAAQNDKNALRRGVIYTTEVPTEMDLGMARRIGLSAIYSTGSGSMRRHDISLTRHDGSGRSVALTGSKANSTGPLIRGRRSQTAWIDPNNASSYQSDLVGFLRYGVNNQRWPVARAIAGLARKGSLASLSFTVPPEGKSLGVSALGLSEKDRHALFLSVAHDLVSRVWGQRENDDENRPSSSYVGWNIGSILVDATGDNILAWGVNTNKLNGTRHGETNLIQYFEDQLGTLPLPAGASFYTTLEPCQMCSGMLASVGRKNNLKVIWGQDDTAILQSALQRGGLGVSRCGSARTMGVRGWSEVLTRLHQDTTARFKREAAQQKRTAEQQLRLRQSTQKRRELEAQLRDAKQTLQGIDRFGSIQTTEFLRQAEAALHFGRSRTRRHMSTVMSQLEDIRGTLDGLGGTFKPSTVRGAQDMAVLIPDLLEDFSGHIVLNKKLATFVEKVGVAMARV